MSGNSRVGRPAIIDGSDRGLADELRCREIGFTNTEVQYLRSRVLQLLNFCIQRQRCRRLDGTNTLTDHQFPPFEQNRIARISTGNAIAPFTPVRVDRIDAIEAPRRGILESL